LSVKRALFKAQKKKTRNKTLIEEMRADGASAAIIFSPGRIKTLRAKYDAREATKQAEEAAKQLVREEKKAQSLTKAAEKQKRRIDRQEQALSRKVS